MGECRNIVAIATEYTGYRWSPLPVPFREKGPRIKEWQKLRLTAADVPHWFQQYSNIGVLLGEASNGLIDVDLDHPLARELAPQFLPATGRIFGRNGNQRSHWLYYVSAPIDTHQRENAAVSGDKKMIVELRSDGAQTVFPGSVHESGEEIYWDEEFEPATVDPQELLAAVDALADEVERRLGLRLTSNGDDDLPDDVPLPDVSQVHVEDGGQANLAGIDLTTTEGLKPGEDFNKRGDVRVVLRRNGWTLVETTEDGAERWRRPGKDKGCSGSLKDGGFWCFTSSTSIPSSRKTKEAYSPFAVLAYLEHGGDFGKATKALAAEGYGTKPKAKEPTRSTPRLYLPEPYVPFPFALLPDPISTFIHEAAKAIGCDPALVGLPLLATLAGCVGSTRRLLIKPGWAAPSVLWTAAVVDSGQQKSPAQSVVTRHLYERQGRDLKEHAERIMEYQKSLANYEQALVDWKKTKGVRGDPPKKPEEPVCKRVIISDSTMEAVADRLQENQRGLLLDRDELSGWLGSYDQYRSGRGGDVSHWLSCYNAKPLLIDRKTSAKKTIYVERAAVSVTGGIQPRILAGMLGKQHFENGLAARFGLGMPPRRSKQWSDARISEDTDNTLEWVYDYLLRLQFREIHDKLVPVDLPLTPDGREAFVEFYNQHGHEQGELTGNLAALWAKLEEVAARIALVMHLVRCSIDDSSLVTPDAVDAGSIMMGVTFARWFGNEGRRIYGVLAETDQDRERRLLIELIQRKGGRITARDLTKSMRRFADSNEAEEALIELAEGRLGRWEEVPTTAKGGRVTRVFRLSVGETPKNQMEKQRFGYADAGEEAQSANNPEMDDGFEAVA